MNPEDRTSLEEFRQFRKEVRGSSIFSTNIVMFYLGNDPSTYKSLIGIIAKTYRFRVEREQNASDNLARQ
jgi:hypothetical protein